MHECSIFMYLFDYKNFWVHHYNSLSTLPLVAANIRYILRKSLSACVFPLSSSTHDLIHKKSEQALPYLSRSFKSQLLILNLALPLATALSCPLQQAVVKPSLAAFPWTVVSGLCGATDTHWKARPGIAFRYWGLLLLPFPGLCSQAMLTKIKIASTSSCSCCLNFLFVQLEAKSLNKS